MSTPVSEYIAASEYFGITLVMAAVICFFIERLNPAEKTTPYFKKDFVKELGLALLNALVFTPIFTFVVSVTLLAILALLAPYQMFEGTIMKLPLIIQIVLGAMIMDFSTYWRHRFTHRHLWPYHSFHHSAEEITWLTSMRLHPVDAFAAMLFDTTVLYFLGFEGPGIVGAAIIIQLYNYFTHLNLNVSFPKPVRYVLASPHYHRWHHATDKAAYDKNFCGVFSLYDILFGTYYHPEELPNGYGLTPREQQEVPKKLIPHLLLPVKKDLRKFFGRKH